MQQHVLVRRLNSSSLRHTSGCAKMLEWLSACYLLVKGQHGTQSLLAVHFAICCSWQQGCTAALATPAAGAGTAAARSVDRRVSGYGRGLGRMSGRAGDDGVGLW